MEALLKDYTACLSRIRACRAPIRHRQRKNDIRRILFARGQEDLYDVDELYAAFSTLAAPRAHTLRQELAAQGWHLMAREERLSFLAEYLPDHESWFPLLADFRAGGYRVLGDVLCDVDDENAAAERKQLHREADSPAFTAMMDAYESKPSRQSYRDAAAAVCRKRLAKIVRLRQAVRYVVALGRRELLWDLLPDEIEKEVLRWKPDAE